MLQIESEENLEVTPRCSESGTISPENKSEKSYAENWTQTESCSTIPSLQIDQETQTTEHKIVYKYMLVPVLQDSNAIDSVALTNDKDPIGIFVETDVNNNANARPDKSKNCESVKQHSQTLNEIISENPNISQPIGSSLRSVTYNCYLETDPSPTPSTTRTEDSPPEPISLQTPCEFYDDQTSSSESTITIDSGSEVSSTGYLGDTESTSGDENDAARSIDSSNTDISMNIALISPHTSTGNLLNPNFPNASISLSSNFRPGVESCPNPSRSSRANQHRPSPHRKKPQTPTTRQSQPQLKRRKSS